MADQPRRSEDVAFEHLKRAYVEKTVREWEAAYERDNGRRPAKPVVKSVRAMLETSAATDQEIRRQIEVIGGVAKREGILDAAALLLWGVSGSLVAALVWEHRYVVPGILVVALSGAVAFQFRGVLRRRVPGWRGLILSTLLIAALLALIYRSELARLLPRLFPG